jgi:8-oxo-dGTP diphosphatase
MLANALTGKTSLIFKLRQYIIKPMSKTYIDKLAFIYLKDQKVLETLSYGKNTWYIPGGKREAGESDNQALIREVKEELHVDLVPNTLRHYGTFEAPAHGKPEGTMVRMTCYTADFTGKLKPTSEVEKLAYFTYANKHKTSPVDHLIFDDLKSKGLIL